MIVAVTSAYQHNIGIVDVTNNLKNNIKASSEREIIDCPSNYIAWFKI